VKGHDKPVDFSVVVSKTEEDFHFPLSAAPELVRIDPDYTLLAKLDFQTPPDMLKRQLKSDMIGRLLAVQLLAKKKDAETVKQLAEVVNGDAFHAVRSEAAKALKTISTPEARTALAQSLHQEDARTRQAVVEALSAFPHPEAQEALWKQAQIEKNPLVLAAIIKTWGSRPGDAKVAVELRKHLAASSYHQAVASAAIAALRAQDDASAVTAVLEKLGRDGLDFPSIALSQAFDAVAFLSRNDKDREPTRTFLVNYLNHPRKEVRVAAAKALGTLRDPKSLAVLQPVANTMKHFKDPVREAAEKSIQAIEAEQTKAQELKDVWSKLQELEKKSEEMNRQLEKSGKKPETPKGEGGAPAKGGKK
ncbi:MAG: HEAT repeat domain-containing protein, partial [Verrucomicrobiaceae bacterium]